MSSYSAGQEEVDVLDSGLSGNGNIYIGASASQLTVSDEVDNIETTFREYNRVVMVSDILAIL